MPATGEDHGTQSPRSAGPPGDLRAGRFLRIPKVWVTPLVLASVVVFLMTLIYFGSVVDPVAHLHDLPVLVVDQDHGATVAGQRVDLGAQVADGLTGARPVTSRLALRRVTWPEAEAAMDNGNDYAAVVIPADFTSSLLGLAGLAPFDATAGQKPSITLEANQRLGSIGTSLATGVLQPALQDASHQIGSHLLSVAASSHPTAAVRAQIADPIEIVQTVYRPLPQHSALGLSAFYISLLTLMCGFLGATIINASVDTALGYTSTELGPKWSQRRPVAISRWQTLVAKWGMAAAVVPVLTGLVVLGAAGILRMDAPDPVLLWLVASFAAVGVAAATLVLFAALGTPGQLVALLIFVYLALASSGGTVPHQALAPFFQFSASFEPLRQILDANRALLYFGGRLAAGLGHALIVLAVELAIWVAIGVAVTRWYDHKGLRRLAPDALEFVNRSADQFVAEQARRRSTPPTGGGPDPT